MKALLNDYLSNRISRRSFIQGLAALGVSTAAADSAASSADAVVAGGGLNGRKITGTGGELMVEQMKAAGVKFLFTNPGSFEVGFFDAFLDQPVSLIMGLHEGVVISMADGYHKVSKEPAFVGVHVIAGTAQSAGQLYNSSRDGSSIVVTAGFLDNEWKSDDVMLGPRPGFNQKEVNRQFTKISWESRDPAGLPVMLRRAFKVAATPPTGPVYLAVPNYVLEAKGITADIYEKNHFMIPNQIAPRTDQVERVAKLLIEAKAPLLFLGDEVAKCDAQREALELAELLGIQVCESRLPAFHSFPRRHPLFAGGFRGSGKDLILNCGAPDMGGGTMPLLPEYDNQTTVICLGLDTDEIGRTHPFSEAVIANVKLGLRALIGAVKSMATADRLAKIAEGREKPMNKKPELAAASRGLAPMHPDELGLALDEELDKDAIIVSENLSGSSHFFSTGFREDEKMWVSTSGAGLGWGVGAATGAKIAEPNRQVVCDIGDGSVMYSASGFWTQARNQVPVLTVVCNNLNYQTVRNAYARYNGKMKAANKYVGMYLGNPEIDFVQLAKSQGLEGIKVENAADLRPAIKRGIAATRAGAPFLIDVRVRRTGAGADSTWFQAYSLAEERKRKV